MTEEQRLARRAEYLAEKKAAKEAKKAEERKILDLEKGMSADQKARVAARQAEIKAETAAKAKVEAETAKAEKLAEKAKIAAMDPETKKAYLAEKKAAHQAKAAEEYAAYLEHTGKKSAPWKKFCLYYPGLSDLLYKVFFFIVFSEGVTLWQLAIMWFLPYAFQSIWDVPFVWPAVALPWQDAAGNALNWAIFNEPVKFIIGDDVLLASTADQVKAYLAMPGVHPEASGLGNFIAFEIAVFTAQCINFPLQRNITYKSHGNPVYQAMWYFIGWLLISVLVNAVWGILNPLMLWWNWADGIIALIKTFITGGLSMFVFFFIFMIIFPAGAADTSKIDALAEVAKQDGLLD